VHKINLNQKKKSTDTDDNNYHNTSGDTDNNSNDFVTVETFERMIKCFGPFYEGDEILDQAKNLLGTVWFAGSMSGVDAEDFIRNEINSCFVVRFSSNPGEYSITFKQKEDVLHSRIPISAKYSLQQYIGILLKKKKFRIPDNVVSEIYHLAKTAPSFHSWYFVR